MRENTTRLSKVAVWVRYNKKIIKRTIIGTRIRTIIGTRISYKWKMSGLVI
jgi:hypothetical protein